ncbi:hypothetical protein PR002_g15418 [Phytophthora rubi]|uniref:Uncharacterized protein n=2 Tax=Phytophthora rubi TaxID=129364 RepID=A0A6A3KRQ2_9STRA|nr:hypothetical protein PR002_g15418 [Phytophthora rubi]
MYDGKRLQHTIEADLSAAAVTGGLVRVETNCGDKDGSDTGDNRAQCSHAAPMPGHGVGDGAADGGVVYAPGRGRGGGAVRGRRLVGRGEGHRAAAVPGVVLVTAPPMVAWCMLPVVGVVAVLCVDGDLPDVVKAIAPLPCQHFIHRSAKNLDLLG